jgi:hypothetical protein
MARWFPIVAADVGAGWPTRRTASASEGVSAKCCEGAGAGAGRGAGAGAERCCSKRAPAGPVAAGVRNIPLGCCRCSGADRVAGI